MTRDLLNLADWSVRDAIEERVQQEDLVRWARTPEPHVPEDVLRKEARAPAKKDGFVGAIIRFTNKLWP